MINFLKKIKRILLFRYIYILRLLDAFKLNKIHPLQKNKFINLADNYKKYGWGSFSLNSLTHETWGAYTISVRNQFLVAPKIDFFGLPVFVETMTGFHRNFENLDYLRQCTDILSEKFNLTDLLTEDLIGYPLLLNNCIFKTSLNRLVHVFQFALIYELSLNTSAETKIFTEWGGGFGGLARIFDKANIQGITYNIVDIPEICHVQYIYLSSTVNNLKVILHDGSRPIEKNSINIIPNSLLPHYKEMLNCDVFISAWALSESSKEAQNFVCSTEFFKSTAALIIHQPISDKHPYADKLTHPLNNYFNSVFISQFPYMTSQTILRATNSNIIDLK